MAEKTAFIFPAFISEYLGNEIELLDAFSSNFQDFLIRASVITDDDYANLSLNDILYTEDELRSQVITYIFSCSLSDILIKKGLKPDVMAGYSMGLYATLYTGGSISFEEGIRLINQAFCISKKVLGKKKASMGSIIGLTFDEITTVIDENEFNAEIANTNSIHSHLITGSAEDVNQLLEKARGIGALNISLLKVSTPYHSRLLENTKEDFQEFILKDTHLNDSHYPIISSIDQKIISSASQIRQELVKNLFTKIDWMATFKKMSSLGINQFIECGAGKSLYKIGRFMPGEFSIFTMNKVSKLI